MEFGVLAVVKNTDQILELEICVYRSYCELGERRVLRVKIEEGENNKNDFLVFYFIQYL